MTSYFNTNKGLIVGIDASRNRSGGAIAHLKGILNTFDLGVGVERIHVWAYESLLDQLPAHSWLEKHQSAALEKSLLCQLWWQAKVLKKEAEKVGCDVLFATDAATLCTFQPLVVLSQDLLSYEPGVMKTYQWGRFRLRLEVIRRVQNHAFRRAAGSLFLTEYARNLVESSCGLLAHTGLAPHGVDEVFRNADRRLSNLQRRDTDINCLYVSSTEFYKHQWNVVKAVRILRDLGYSVTLTLVGGGTGAPRRLLDQTINECGAGSWVTQLEFLDHAALPAQLDTADIFIFASSCENLPVTLLEGMARGLPIACSNRGPMPEVLGDAGEYFDPLQERSIARAIRRLIIAPERSKALAKAARERASKYSWEICSRRTFGFVRESYIRYTSRK